MVRILKENETSLIIRKTGQPDSLTLREKNAIFLSKTKKNNTLAEPQFNFKEQIKDKTSKY